MTSQMLSASRIESASPNPRSAERSIVQEIAPSNNPSWDPSKLVTAIDVSTRAVAPGTAAHEGAPVRNLRSPSRPSRTSKGASRENISKYAEKASPRRIHSSTPNRPIQTNVIPL
jgi:hypothetical protein